MRERQNAVRYTDVGILDPYQLRFAVMLGMCHDRFGAFSIAVSGFYFKYRRRPMVIGRYLSSCSWSF